MGTPNSPGSPVIPQPPQPRAEQLADAIGQWSRATVAILFWATVVTAAASAAYVCVRATIWTVNWALRALGG